MEPTSREPDPELQPLEQWLKTLVAFVQSDRADLTNRQMAILLMVYLRRGPHTVRGLAAALDVSKPVVTRALNTLGALGYVRRQKDEADLRNVFILPTEQGRAFLGEFADLIEHAGAARGGREAGESRAGLH